MIFLFLFLFLIWYSLLQIKKLEENNRSVKENEKLALQVRQLLAAVEKLDSSREKLLAEVILLKFVPFSLLSSHT